MKSDVQVSTCESILSTMWVELLVIHRVILSFIFLRNHRAACDGTDANVFREKHEVGVFASTPLLSLGV